LEIEEQKMNGSTAAPSQPTKICSINSLSNQSNKKMTTFVWLIMFSFGLIDGVQSVDIARSITPNSTMLLIEAIRCRRNVSFQSQDEN
jgi:hypothetical protein